MGVGGLPAARVRVPFATVHRNPSAAGRLGPRVDAPARTIRARRRWRTLLGAAVGAAGGALYAHYVGCHTGTCLITSSVWTAGAFFGLTGALVAMPGPPRDRANEDHREPHAR